MPDSINKLEIYRDAMDIGATLWSFVAQWDHFSKNTIGQQIVRAADSLKLKHGLKKQSTETSSPKTKAAQYTNN